MGFEYVPNKYFFRGEFKDGVKEGKGSLKVFPSNPEYPQIFMAY